MTKKELEQELARLAADYTDDMYRKDETISDLQHGKDELENELVELRGLLPELPTPGYRHDAAGYIQEFNRIRHLKEIPQ